MIKLVPFLLSVAFLFSCSAENPFQSFYAQMYINEGNRFFTEGEYKKAAEFYDKAVELDPQGDTRFYSFFLRGSAYYRLGKYSAAIDDLTSAVQVSPKSESSYLLRGNSYLKREQYDEAHADFEAAVRMNPSNADAHDSLGDYYYSQNSFQKAMDEYALAVQYEPEMDDVYRKRADIFASIDMPDNAVSNYNYAIMLNPTNRMAFEGRAQANAKLGRKINSALDVLTAKDLSREEAKQYWKQALRALGKSDTETALHMYGMSLETDPTGSAGSGNPGDTYYDRGVVYLHEKQYEQALIDFKKTVTLNPKNWKAYSSLGICYFELGYYQMASEQFRGSLRNNSRDELSVYYLGRIEMKMSRPAKAIEEFTSAIDLEPKLLQAYSERADAFLAMESFQNAVGDYSLLVDKGWNDPTVLLKRGIAYDALSMYDDAVADFSEYIRVSPRNDAPMGFLYRGNSFMEMKKYAMANRDYSKFISTVMTNGPYDTNSVAVALTNMNKCFLVLVKRRKI